MDFRLNGHCEFIERKRLLEGIHLGNEIRIRVELCVRPLRGNAAKIGQSILNYIRPYIGLSMVFYTNYLANSYIMGLA